MSLKGLEQLIRLFDIEDKHSVEKYCRNLVISSEHLFHIIKAGRRGGMTPYIYICHFSESTPEHLRPTEYEFSALSKNGVGTFGRAAKKTVSKISQVFKDRRLFAAHLFYVPSKEYWHLFYFDQRDIVEKKNHWKIGGPHIHYSRESFSNEHLDEIWKKICCKSPCPPKSIHVRYDYQDNGKRHKAV